MSVRRRKEKHVGTSILACNPALERKQYVEFRVCCRRSMQAQGCTVVRPEGVQLPRFKMKMRKLFCIEVVLVHP